MRSVELFAGGGGAALGLHMAGFQHELLVEWDASAAATLRAAALGPVHQGDVREVDWSGVASPDLLWASPPCQAWSSAGKRQGVTDERNGWPWTFDVVDALRPTWLVCENVPGLLHHNPRHDQCAGCYWEQVILPAARARFGWVGVWRLDAADFGVPQRRHRVFLVAGPRLLRRPAPTHSDPRLLGLFSHLQPWVTVREALGMDVGGINTVKKAGIPIPERGSTDLSERPAWTVSTYQTNRGGSMFVHEPPSEAEGELLVRSHGTRPVKRRSLDEPAPAILAPDSGGYDRLSVRDRHPPNQLDAPAFTVRSGGDGHGAPSVYLCTNGTTGLSRKPVDGPGGVVGTKGNAYLDAPSPTVLANEVKGHTNPHLDRERATPVSRASDALYLGTGRRRLTYLECAALQSFPPDWPWQGTVTDIYRQVGNAVPPPLAMAIGTAILKEVRDEH